MPRPRSCSRPPPWSRWRCSARIGRAVEGLTRPARSAAGHLAAAQVARRLQVYAVPAVLTVLAVGATTLAGLYSGTSAVLRDNLAAVAQGAPVRATLDEPPRTTGDGVVPPPPALPTDLEGAASAPVWLDANGRLGDLSVPLTMASSGELAEVVTAPDLPGGAALVPVASLAPEAVDRDGVPVPEDTDELEVALDVALTVDERTLEGLQRGYEQTVQDVRDGVYGTPEEDEEVARDTARQVMDTLLLRSLGQVEWQVTLLLVEEGSGLYHRVESAPVVLDLPQVRPPWVGPDAVEATEVPEGTVIDYTEADVRQGGGSAELTFTFPGAEGTAYTLTGVELTTPRSSGDFFGSLWPDVEASLTVTTADGTSLLDGPTEGWGSADAGTPAQVAEVEAENATGPDAGPLVILPSGSGLGHVGSRPVPATLDTGAERWTLTARTDHLLPERLTVGPGLGLDDGAAGRPEEDDTDPSSEGIPVALTAATARAATLQVGDRAELTAFGTRLPVRIAALVPAVPGSLAPQAVLVDRDAVAAHFAEVGRTLPYPTELWVRPAAGTDVEAARPVVEQLAAVDGVALVAGPGRVAVTDATSAARLVFWVASAGAVLLAVTGIAAVAATLLGHRRPEVAVLRALGMPPATQARSRALELGGVVLASIVLGLGASWLVGRAVVVELARSTTLPGQVRLPAALLLEPGPWAALLGLGLAAVLAVVVVQAGRVRAQALDLDYREEIR